MAQHCKTENHTPPPREKVYCVICDKMFRNLYTGSLRVHRCTECEKVIILNKYSIKKTNLMILFFYRITHHPEDFEKSARKNNNRKKDRTIKVIKWLI